MNCICGPYNCCEICYSDDLADSVKETLQKKDTFDTVTTNDYDEASKQDALDIVKNSSTEWTTDEFLLESTEKKGGWVSHKGYGNLEMRTFVYGEQGVRMLCRMKKGHIEPPHYHKGRYEWFVLSGKYKVRNPVTGKESIVKAGDYYYNPPNTPHQEECLEDGELLWMYDRLPDCHCLTTDMQEKMLKRCSGPCKM